MADSNWGNNPFNKWKKGFAPASKGPQDPLFGFQAQGTPQAQQRKQEAKLEGTKVQEFPYHLFVPYGAEGADLRNLALVPAGTSFDIINFVAPNAGKLFFIGYTIFTDALNFSNIEFQPTVNGSRILPFHGNPNPLPGDPAFKMGLGVSVDFATLIPCQVGLNPGDRLIWTVTNNEAVDQVFGVRMSGYLDTTGTRLTTRFGG